MRARGEAFDHLEHLVGTLPRAEWPRLIGELERLKTQLLLGLVGPNEQDPSEGASQGPLLTIPQVALALSIPRSQAYELARQGKLKCVHIGRYIRVEPMELKNFQRRHSTRY